jgi:16S rRNA (cytidine1402-2'-O)-methyltransferase
VGTLFVVATPIGNLEDLSPRAVRVLREVDVVAAEDTRHSRKLLSRFDVHTPLISYHAHNQRSRREEILRALDSGDVALVTDAGTPAISDPGADLVAAAHAAGHRVTPIPGASALAAAVSASGLIDGPFASLGFLPRKREERRRIIGRAAASGFPLVLFESARRIASTLAELRDALGDRDAVLLRELTKVHEEIRPGSLSALHAWAAAGDPPGEVTLVIAGAPVDLTSDADPLEILETLRRAGLSPSQAAREAATLTGLPRSELYRMATTRYVLSVGLEPELPLPDENALQDPLGDQKRPQR